MSLDLIVEQLKHEMSLKGIEDESKDDKGIKIWAKKNDENIVTRDSTEGEKSRISENEMNAKSKNEENARSEIKENEKSENKENVKSKDKENARSENNSEKKLEEGLERECDTEKSLKEMSRCVTETVDSTVKDISRNIKELEEEREIKDLHQRATTISSREP
ncbi:hypothetical protein KPH14_010186 [Odynerus spinipes]|uniref:Uncharacterized protein n=1 Tax=Odynerus spinipes TaxID=1348599 RepID=A0AAD9VSW4_9HYME|nr:hypothetical protein KPH14_010186 [Odynerus spinipes]